MKICIVTDAWLPQVNGVVTTLVELRQGLEACGHEVVLIEPSGFKCFACPGYREIKLAWRPAQRVQAMLNTAAPDVIHIATEGPLGRAARAHCWRNGLAFTTAFHTRFPDILAKALHIPQRWGYGWFKRFHAPSSGIMVPSAGMLEILQGYGFERLRQWSHGVDLSLFQPVPEADLGLPRPVFLYVGRVSYEKNLDAFLTLRLPGSKVVYGVGPMLDEFRREHPEVHWRGVVPRSELPRIYSAADSFVFPSRSETFGLVMLEAMACGTPVAAYPMAGPLDVVGTSPGGVLDVDLARAAMHSLEVPRYRARARALEFDWHAVCRQFIDHLVPVHAGRNVGMTLPTREVPELVP